MSSEEDSESSSGSIDASDVSLPTDLSLESLGSLDIIEDEYADDESEEKSDEDRSLDIYEGEDADDESEEKSDEDILSNKSSGEELHQGQSASTEEPTSSNVAQKKRRAKRGGFKKGFLKSKKRIRGPRSDSGTSEGYTDEMDALLPSAPEGEGHSSFAETIPSEGVTENVDDPDESELQGPKKKKKRKRLGRMPKYLNKPSAASTSQDEKAIIDTGSEDDDKEKEDPVMQKLEILTKNEADPQESLKDISDHLKLTLDSAWAVTVIDNVLSVSKISVPFNPVVEKSITWDGININFIVHNLPLPKRNIMNQLKMPDLQNFGAVADFLTRVSARFLQYEVCCGVQSYADLWPSYADQGHIVEKIYGAPCLRSSNCRLSQLYPGKCGRCQELEKTLREKERQLQRTATAKGTANLDKINHRYLQAEDLRKKCAKIQAEKKLSKQTVTRLRKRVDKLLKERSELIDRSLSNDFVTIMNDNADKMSAMEKIFWEQQSIALSKREKMTSMRWHPAMIRLALHLHSISPAAYDFLQGFITLPSQRRLYDYSQFTEIKEGISKDIQEELKKLIDDKCPEEVDKYFTLLLDEMSIRSDLVYHARTNELIGYTNLSSLEEELSQLEAEVQGKPSERRLAKKVLVFMLNGAVNPIRHVAAVYSTDDLTSSQLYARAWDVIYFSEDAGAKVLGIIFDGASVNRKFIQMHCGESAEEPIHWTTNPVGDSRALYFMLDIPHLIKTFRNCLANSGSHRNSRNLVNNDQLLTWQAIEALYEIIEKHKFKATKLTLAHVKLTSFSCMKVFLAVQVLSKAVAEALRKFKHVSPLNKYYSEELVKFIEMMNRCFDCLNGGLESLKKGENSDLLEYTSISDARFDFLEHEFLKYLDDWETYVKTKPGKYSKEERSRMTISYQSLEGMKISIKSFIKMTKLLLEEGASSVSARRFNQDPLEQYFSELRRRRGSDNNPTLKQVLHDRLTHHQLGQQVPSASAKGNTQSLKRALIPDCSDVPVRKKKA